jgi:hypothetical protein
MSKFDLIIPIIFFVLIAITILTTYFQKKKLDGILQTQADKHNGYLESSSFLLPTRLILPIGEQALNVYYVPGGRRNSAKTVAELTGTFGPFPQISVRRNTLFQKTLEAFGKERFLIGNEEFDKMFVVSAQDENAARQILSMDIQRNLLEMTSKIPYIEIDAQLFRFMVMHVLKDNDSYDVFIDTALAIWKKLNAKKFT